jgi:hypothetical protein
VLHTRPLKTPERDLLIYAGARGRRHDEMCHVTDGLNSKRRVSIELEPELELETHCEGGRG